MAAGGHPPGTGRAPDTLLPPGTWQSLPSTPALEGLPAASSESSWKLKGFRFDSVLNPHSTDPGQTDRQTQTCAGGGPADRPCAKVEVHSLEEPQAPGAKGWGPYRQPVSEGGGRGRPHTAGPPWQACSSRNLSELPSAVGSPRATRAGEDAREGDPRALLERQLVPPQGKQ